MKPFYAKTTSIYDESVVIRYDEMPNFYRHWHYHDEYELVYIHKSNGIRYVGDNISPYKPGDLVLLGSGLPHIWLNEKSLPDTEIALTAATIIHFQRKFVHNDFIDSGMMSTIKNLFKGSERGIRFFDFENIEKILNDIQKSQSTNRMLAILNLLNQLGNHKKIEYLTSNDYNLSGKSFNDIRLSNVHDFIIQHFMTRISINKLASIAMMTPQAFCNYFKAKTRKTLTKYVNDIRIGYSKKLLIDSDLNVDQIAYKSGFNNTTYFNRKFKQQTKMTPREYRNQFCLTFDNE